LRIGFFILTILIVHVALCLYVILVPEKMMLQNKAVKIYKQLMILGPFFTESRIKSSHYLSVRYKKNGTWSSPREYAKENFLFYCENPWRYDRLPYGDYEKRLSYTVGKLAEKQPLDLVKKSSSFRELNEFILQENIHEKVDSIHLIYGLNQYHPDKGIYTLDTIFNWMYNPNSIGKSKR